MQNLLKKEILQSIRYFFLKKRKANTKVACHKIKLVKQNKKKSELHVWGLRWQIPVYLEGYVSIWNAFPSSWGRLTGLGDVALRCATQRKERGLSYINKTYHFTKLCSRSLKSYLAVTILFIPWAKNHLFDNLISIRVLHQKCPPSDSIRHKEHNS